MAASSSGENLTEPVANSGENLTEPALTGPHAHQQKKHACQEKFPRIVCVRRDPIIKKSGTSPASMLSHPRADTESPPPNTHVKKVSPGCSSQGLRYDSRSVQWSGSVGLHAT